MLRSKKFFVFVGMFLLISSILSFSSAQKAEAEEVETVIHNICPDSTEELVGGNYLAQTFVANVDTIVDVGLTVRNKGASTIKFNLALMDYNGNWIASRPQSLAPGPLWPYRYISPQYPIDVTVGDRYSLWIYPYSGYESNQLYVRGSAVGQEQCYPNGSSFSNIFFPLNKDFNFVVFGYNKDAAPPAEVSGDSSAPPTQSSLASITSTSNTQSESSATTAKKSAAAQASNAPKNLTATYNKENKNVELRWEKSTLANITGYEIYRANSLDNVYKKVNEVKADQLEYIDSRISYNDQFSYYVTAVSAKARSDNSNTVTITIDDTALIATTPAPAPKEQSFLQQKLQFIINHPFTTLILAGLLVILIGTLLLIILHQRRTIKKLR